MSFKHPQIKKYKLLADETWLSTGDKERGLQKVEILMKRDSGN